SLKMFELVKAETQPRAFGRVMWDHDKDVWHVSVFDMQPPPAGREYELWFITPDEKKYKAGMMTVDAGGNGSMIVPVRKDIGAIALAAFTDEPAGGVEAPTGKPQLVGKVQ